MNAALSRYVVRAVAGFAALVMGMLLAGCDLAASDASNTSSAPLAASESAAMPEPARDFTLQSLDGEPVTLGECRSELKRYLVAMRNG